MILHWKGKVLLSLISLLREEFFPLLLVQNFFSFFASACDDFSLSSSLHEFFSLSFTLYDIFGGLFPLALPPPLRSLFQWPIRNATTLCPKAGPNEHQTRIKGVTKVRQLNSFTTFVASMTF